MILSLSSILKDGHYRGRTVREILIEHPDYIYHRYVSDIDFDINLDIILALEIKRFNMRKAYIKRLNLLYVNY